MNVAFGVVGAGAGESVCFTIGDDTSGSDISPSFGMASDFSPSKSCVRSQLSIPLSCKKYKYCPCSVHRLGQWTAQPSHV